MEFVLATAVLCLAACTAVLGSSVPFLFWKCLRLHTEALELQKQIDTLDETIARLLERIGVPVEEET